MKCKECKQQKKADNCQRCRLDAIEVCEKLGKDLIQHKKTLRKVLEITEIHHLSSLDKIKNIIVLGGCQIGK